ERVAIVLGIRANTRNVQTNSSQTPFNRDVERFPVSVAEGEICRSYSDAVVQRKNGSEMLALRRDHTHAVAGCGCAINIALLIELHAVTTNRIELLTIR